MNGYTSSPRRGSGGGGGGASAANTHAYAPGESVHEAAAAGHHQASQHQISASYMSDASPSSSVAHRHGQPAASGSGSSSHAAHSEGRQIAVASRH
jgi:hypothetical protein